MMPPNFLRIWVREYSRRTSNPAFKKPGDLRQGCVLRVTVRGGEPGPSQTRRGWAARERAEYAEGRPRDATKQKREWPSASLCVEFLSGARSRSAARCALVDFRTGSSVRERCMRLARVAEGRFAARW